ncbi:hypothetical protein SAY87_011777 [Trapa incisa]|uniref:RNA polymerase II transcription factor B subunit 2 n=1 Tax=Trapa incisa TaxID=236973 RepID=A0AAN7JJA7_9MYRT|nr:hypothetical protein SAY87_011777 [Trapa incisa]
MCYIEEPITSKSLEEWLLPDGSSKHKVAIDKLLQLRIFLESFDKTTGTSYRVNPTFQKNLRTLITCGAILPREPMPSNITIRLLSSTVGESLYNAFENGITAEQIISFLQQNAHARVAERVPSVPENVTEDVFEMACNFSRECEGLLWEDSKKMRIVVNAEVHLQMLQK